MIKQEAEEFKNILNTIGEMYSKPSASSFLVALWWGALRNYSLSEVKKGLSLHLSNPDNFGGNIMPKPADVIRNLEGTTAEKSGLAWSKVDRSVREVGPYQDVCFDDPIIHTVITDMGGWIRLCNENTDKEWPFIQGEFENRYKGYASKGQVPEFNARLTGMTNANNRIEGFAIEDPILVGNPALCMQVLKVGSETQKKEFMSLSSAKSLLNKKQRKTIKGDQ